MPAVGVLDGVRRFVVSVAPAAADPLARFVASRDEEAFAQLVRQHAALVFDVCRSVLKHDADAEDAFQATFLVLARNAASVRNAGSLAAWLHGVALRVSRKARSAATRRRDRERALPPPTPAPDRDELSWADVRRVLHDELAALPAAYRVPLVLCYLQGTSQDRAAADFGLSKSALKKRLERGRDKLRAALVRRGLGPAAVLAAFSVTPATIASPVIAAAVRVVLGGHNSASVSVQHLANDGSLTMTLWKCAAGALVVAGALAVTICAQEPPTRPATKPPITSGGENTAPPPGKAVGDEEWLAGEWKVKSITKDGDSASAEDIKDASIEFRRDRFETRGANWGKFRHDWAKVRNGSFRLAPETSPKGIDMTIVGPATDRKVQGIYHFNKDEVRIALRVSREELGRPKGFHSSPGTGIVTLILEPVEKKGPPPRPAPNPEAKKPAKPIALPTKTPFDNEAKKRTAYLNSYRHGHAWASGDQTVCPSNPQDDNLHAIRGWVEGWQAGVKAGGTGDLPAKYAPFIVWRE